MSPLALNQSHVVVQTNGVLEIPQLSVEHATEWTH